MRLLYCATGLLLAEMKRKKQEFKRVMQLWKQQQRRALETQAQGEICAAGRDGQIFFIRQHNWRCFFPFVLSFQKVFTIPKHFNILFTYFFFIDQHRLECNSQVKLKRQKDFFFHAILFRNLTVGLCVHQVFKYFHIF